MKFERINKARLDEQNSSQDDGSVWELLLFTIFFIIVFSSIARAEGPAVPPTTLESSRGSTAESSVSTPASVAPIGPIATDAPQASASIETSIPAKSLFSYSGFVLIETASQLNDADETVYSGLYRLALTAKHNPSNLSGLLRFDYERQYTHQNDEGTDGTFANPLFGVTRTFAKEELGNSYLDTLTLAMLGSVPGNRESVKRHFQYSAGLMLTATKALGKFSLLQTLQYTRRQYEFDIADDGAVNSPNSYRSVSEVSYNLTEKLALTASVLYDYAVSFQGVGRATELSSLSVDYTFTDKVSTSLGVATQRGTLEADGETNRVLIYDPRVASAFFDLVLKF